MNNSHWTTVGMVCSRSMCLAASPPVHLLLSRQGSALEDKPPRWCKVHYPVGNLARGSCYQFYDRNCCIVKVSFFSNRECSWSDDFYYECYSALILLHMTDWLRVCPPSSTIPFIAWWSVINVECFWFCNSIFVSYVYHQDASESTGCTNLD